MKNNRQNIAMAEFVPIRALSVYALVFIAAGSALSLIVAVPLWLQGAHSQRIAGAFVRLFFSFICHQDPERSFLLGGHALAVCGRCTGLYVGFFLGVLFFPWMRPFGNGPAPTGFMLVLAGLPMAVESAVENIGGVPFSNATRAATGVCLGAAVPFYVLPAFFQLIDQRFNRRG